MDWIKDYVVIFKDEIYNECVQINIKKVRSEGITIDYIKLLCIEKNKLIHLQGKEKILVSIKRTYLRQTIISQ